MAQIVALRPALVIVADARYLEEPEARPLAGVPTGQGSVCLNGLAATFGFLDRAAARVALISDVPTPQRPAPTCVSNHLSDVQACDTTLSAASRLPGVKSEKRDLAQRADVDWIDPTSWFCTATRRPR
jgi:SGNH domain (fused to AT3 domains)